MASQDYYNQGGYQQQNYAPGGGYPQQPQPAYGPPQGHPQQGGYYPPQGQPPMQYQQQPPPQRGKKSGGGNCLTACLAALCCCCVIDETCECCAECSVCGVRKSGSTDDGKTNCNAVMFSSFNARPTVTGQEEDREWKPLERSRPFPLLNTTAAPRPHG
ncbi:hypothetical protein CPLU01_02937 [Colletotrichum plurivorum]|uniref:Cysteine-rich transmembrane domain-containing protein n=1 Tax=Colletotrichum plurivorum TaxID=2175906 RepID=A0A8H6KTV9_9PEZI|nr:hypothetical protein CPLU01_02937 [Colletotrichum plurivorum]